jgi:predicted Zn-dependent peptidase
MSSRLFVEVREKRGLAYRIGTGTAAYDETGDFSTSAGLTSVHLVEALDIILAEHRRLLHEKVLESELKRIKDYIKGKFAIGLELSEAQASYYAEQELLEHHIFTPHERLARFEAVTVDELQEVAREVFRPDKLNVALVGPVDHEDEAIKDLLTSYAR